MKKKKEKDFWGGILIVFLSAVLSFLITNVPHFEISPLKELELRLIDKRFQERGAIDIKDSSNIILLEINQSAYDQIPKETRRWPWPRSVFARVVNNLSKAGVRSIGIDINFSNPDSYSPSNDSLMAESIKQSGRVVLAGKIDISNESKRKSGKSFVSKTNYNLGNIFFGVDSSIGIVQVPSDNDGVYRRYFPFVRSEVIGKSFPSFGFAIINKFKNLKYNYPVKDSAGFFILDDIKIPKWDSESMLINFYGGNATFKRVNLIDVLDDKNYKTEDEKLLGVEINTWDDPDIGLLHSGMFKDKIVIIGSTMPEDRDLLPVSFSAGKKGSNIMYGVEFHANVVQNILWRDFLYKQSAAAVFILTVLISFLAFIMNGAVRKLNLKNSIVNEILNFVLIACGVYIIYRLAVFIFIELHLVMPVVSYSLAVVLSYFTTTAYNFIIERKQNLVIKNMFSQYVSKEIVTELLNNPSKLRLGGERKEITVMFSDIANFTSFSEKKQPEELVGYINEFLNEMSEIIIEHKGTVDKYLGDAIMAFWGAPVEIKDHALLACNAALKMQKRLVELRNNWMSVEEIPIYIRIGINTGEAIVGNIGGSKRFDYTVLGDNVNLASRLEGANKAYGTNIMISDSTYELIKDHFLVRELDIIRVKGKTAPTKIYELISTKDDAEAMAALEKLDFYFQGLTLYKMRNFEAACDYFRRAFEQLKDYPSRVYAERCEFYISSPPPEDWDGVFELTSK
ncbi:adenylate cyclase [Melioribacter roseus P3M-2]|uniref:Adenylate cyclase n=1 Tax=Melioribacter roseus (strain DSM 23840 / JCM 17771 / VKM B-2668 / P3M-2) TaxID=1191523 RepID=I6ZWR2_MELRP|nr:adenylate/guanylate cyclase domain-containing protein [Melioribacter roseus]AFN73498.1 adenylate cyclase [Melioribacter roseus P3M-2]